MRKLEIQTQDCSKINLLTHQNRFRQKHSAHVWTCSVISSLTCFSIYFTDKIYPISFISDTIWSHLPPYVTGNCFHHLCKLLYPVVRKCCWLRSIFHFLRKKNIYALPETEILIQKDQEVQMAVKTFGKGRGVYISGLPYSFKNSRVLYRAVLWSASAEEELHWLAFQSILQIKSILYLSYLIPFDLICLHM